MLTITRKLLPFVPTKKRSVFISFYEKVNLTGNYYDGGSKSDYMLLKMNGKKQTLTGKRPFWDGGDDDVTLEPGDIVLETGMFCGKTATPHVYGRIADIVRRVHPHELDSDTPFEVLYDWFSDQSNTKAMELLQALAS